MKLKDLFLSIAIGATCLSLATMGTPSAWAQQAAGSITGTVTDPSGSALPNATVTATDVDRGTTWTTKTSSAGLYSFPQISVGNIEVRVNAPGFSRQTHTSFSLVVDQVARVDFKMSVGTHNESIEVTTAPPLLQSDSTENSTLLDAKAVSSLPMASRDINQLTLLAPGVVSPNIFAFESAQTTFGTGRPYVNGAREQDNNFTLDGMDVNQADNNDVAYVPSPDAIQNMNIITSNAPADFGNYIGGVIVETTKSGTNQFHGNVYEYFRNTILNANSWQDKANAFLVGVPGAATLTRPTLQWNEFGGTVGGPILKDKLFFFADVQVAMNNTPRTAQSNSVIPSAYLAGNFAALCTSQGATFVNGVCSNPLYQLYQPAAGTNPANRLPFLNNQVPISSKVAASMVSSSLFQQQEEQQNYYSSGYVHAYQGDMKIDWQASPKDHISGRYSQMYTINTTQNGTDELTPNLTREYPLKNFVVNYDRAITPSLVNEVRLGGQIFPANDQTFTNASGGNLPSQFGLPGVAGGILPQMNFGYETIGSTNAAEIFHDSTIEAEDSITWTHGKHQIHAGFELYHYIMNDTFSGLSGGSGSFTFTGQYTANTGITVNQNGQLVTPQGNAFADFLLGMPEEVQDGTPLNFHLRNSLFSGFATDTYRVSPTVTLILGLRYELTTARGDKNPNNNVNFALTTGAPEIGTNYNTYTGIDNFQPRIGIAWKPSWDQSSVFRGAYDISSYMEGNGLDNMAIMNPPNVIATDIKNLTSTNTPQTTLDQGYSTFSSACTTAQLETFASNCISGVQVHATNPNLQPAVDQQWNFVFEHQFKGNATMTLGYVGNKIDHMADIYLYNQKQLLSSGQVVPGPYMTQLIADGVGQARYNASDGISRYNALEATMAQRNFHGLDYNFSYTWSKCLTNSLGYFGSYGDEEGIGESQTQATQNFFQNEYNPRGDYGRCTTDVSSELGGYGVYSLPVGTGKLIGGQANRAVNRVIGGWQTALSLTLHSGFGITPFAGSYMTDSNPNSASSLVGSYEPRPDCVADAATNQSMQTVQIGSSIGRVNLNPGAVTGTQNGQYGNCETGSLRGPSLKTADLSLMKSVPVTERVNMAFTAQFINLTNTPVFSVPSSWWGQYSSCASCSGVRTTGVNGGGSGTTGLFGLVDGSNPGREIELALKLNY
ncbi:MAG TPA: carboxypeptidase-like regulatory domain-containing protein [Granulicella sp.]|nr:carboxypeptidase-like regulatory domain-containing protein [Granulicella sp.]